MVFITLEDEHGFVNLAIPPNVYDKHFESIESQGFLCAYGVLQQVGASHSILVKSIVEYAEAKPVSLRQKTASAPAHKNLPNPPSKISHSGGSHPRNQAHLKPLKKPRAYH
ncbi:MAG: hypothetical protein R2827_10990 [Bdellovibrionales bacterium]